jgi:hypothetical protein
LSDETNGGSGTEEQSAIGNSPWPGYAAPTRLSLPLALADVALLTSGGLRGMIGKR